MKQELLVLNCSETVLILERDFLRKFGTVEFDFEKHRVRLGASWSYSEVNVHGGEALASTSTVNAIDSHIENRDWNISTELDLKQQTAIRDLLETFGDVFAEDPKRPSIMNLGEHVIETKGVQP